MVEVVVTGIVDQDRLFNTEVISMGLILLKPLGLYTDYKVPELCGLK